MKLAKRTVRQVAVAEARKAIRSAINLFDPPLAPAVAASWMKDAMAFVMLSPALRDEQVTELPARVEEP